MEGSGSDPLPIPPSYLVLHKLKQWDQCWTRALGNRNDQRVRSAHWELMTTLKALRNSQPKFHHDPNYDRKLHNESAARADRFLAAHSSYGNEWRQMGFCGGPGPRVSSTSTSAVPEAPVQPSKTKLSFMQIRRLAAQTTVAILMELGLPCAIFGSMACKLYGNQRLPNDIDILVLPPPERASITQEEIKALIVRHAPPTYQFVLKRSRNPEATYKVLHFVAKPRPSTSPSSDSIIPNIASMSLHDPIDDDDTTQDFISSIPKRLSSKVDILIPGVMHLPALPTSMITTQSFLPLVPFPVLLLHKLQGWADHRVAKEERYRAKIGEDVRDLEWCLKWANVKRHLFKYVINMNNGNHKERWKKMWSDRRMFSEEFEELSRVRVAEFCEEYGHRQKWEAIGFEI